MSLSAVKIKNIKPESRVRRYYDEKGLYLEVSPKGHKWWRIKYRFEGREKTAFAGGTSRSVPQGCAGGKGQVPLHADQKG